MKALLITAVSAAMLFATFNAKAAEVTKIARPTKDHKVGLQFGIRYNFTRDTGQISREQPCEPGTDSATGLHGITRCNSTTGAMHVLNRELDYSRNNNALDLDLRIALPKRTEFRIVLPIGLADQTRYDFARDISPINSSIEPTPDRIQTDLTDSDPFFDTYEYFKISDGSQPPKRSGLGDLEIAFNWLAMSQKDHADWANLLLGISYIAPTGKVRAGGNSAYGDGINWLQLRLAASRQIKFVEPFMGITYSAPLGGSRGIFPTDIANQSYFTPGHKLDFTAGTDFELYKDPSQGINVRLGLSAVAGVQTAGRGRSALFEGFAGSPCNNITHAQTATPTDGQGYEPDPTKIEPENAKCGWLTQQPGLADSDGVYSHDGITTLAPVFYFGAHANILAQFQRNIGLKFSFSWLAYTNHLMTNENAGVDHSGDNSVDMKVGSAERNPDYNPTYDAPGKRFVMEGLRRIALSAELYTRF